MRRDHTWTPLHSISVSPAKTFPSPSSATKWISSDIGQYEMRTQSKGLTVPIYQWREFAVGNFMCGGVIKRLILKFDSVKYDLLYTTI